MSFPWIRGTQGTQTTAASTSIIVKRETIAGVNLNDLLIVKISYTAAPTPNILAGWTRRGFQANGTLLGQVWFLKYATAADCNPFATYPFTFSASTTAWAGIKVLANVDPTLDLATVDFIQSTGTTNAPTTATFNTSQPDSLIVDGVATRTVSAVTEPSGFSESVDSGSTVAAPTTIRGQLSTKQQASVGATGALVASIATSQAWVSGAIAIPGPDYPAFRAGSTGTSATPNATVAKPAGVKIGDLLLHVVELAATSPSTFQVHRSPTFAPLCDVTSGGTRVSVFWKIADATDQNVTTSYSINHSTGTATMTVHMLAIRNVRASAIGAWSLVALASTATPTTESITTQLANALLVAIFDQVGSNTATAPTGFTERTDSVGMETSTNFQTTQGASGTKQATYTGAAVSIAGLLEILNAKGYQSDPAMDAGALWGTPEFYMPVHAPMDAAYLWGTPELYLPIVAAAGAPNLMLLGVG